MYKELPIEILEENPQNSNRISRMFAVKLRKNIGDIGFYETLTVRLHPEKRGKFEVINGHARLSALRELGIAKAKCDIWDVDDSEAQLFLAILNKLRGSEVPELRMSLLYDLLKQHSKDELAAHIPETVRYLEILERLPEEIEKLPDDEYKPGIIIINFYLNKEQNSVVNRALNHVMEKYCLSDSAQGITKIAEEFLESEVEK